MQEETKHIVGTDLLDYSFKVEQAIKEGWTFSTKNEYAPRAWPHMFEAWMVKESKVDEDMIKESGTSLSNAEATQSLSVERNEAKVGNGMETQNKPAVASSKAVGKRNVKK